MLATSDDPRPTGGAAGRAVGLLLASLLALGLAQFIWDGGLTPYDRGHDGLLGGLILALAPVLAWQTRKREDEATPRDVRWVAWRLVDVWACLLAVGVGLLLLTLPFVTRVPADQGRLFGLQHLVEAHRQQTGAYPAPVVGGLPGPLLDAWRAHMGRRVAGSPYGGPNAAVAPDGLLQLPDRVGRWPDRKSALAHPEALGLALDPDRAGVLFYMRVVPGPGGRWLALPDHDGVEPYVAYQAYVVGIYDRRGDPMFFLRGE